MSPPSKAQVHRQAADLRTQLRATLDAMEADTATDAAEAAARLVLTALDLSKMLTARRDTR